MELRHKVVVITGASSGIGKHLALQLLNEGSRVAGWQRRSAGINHENYFDVECDVSELRSVEDATAQTLKRLGKIDILINNAGLGFFGKMHEMEPQKWYKMFDVNVHGVYHCIRASVPEMIKAGEGHIINIGSIAGKQAVTEGAGYSATKFALTAISQALFKELRRYNIKVTVVFPGSTNTSFFDNVEHTLRPEDMIQPGEIANLIIQLLKTPKDLLPAELEVRTMRAK